MEKHEKRNHPFRRNQRTTQRRIERKVHRCFHMAASFHDRPPGVSGCVRTIRWSVGHPIDLPVPAAENRIQGRHKTIRRRSDRRRASRVSHHRFLARAWRSLAFVLVRGFHFRGKWRSWLNTLRLNPAYLLGFGSLRTESSGWLRIRWNHLAG